MYGLCRIFVRFPTMCVLLFVKRLHYVRYVSMICVCVLYYVPNLCMFLFVRLLNDFPECVRSLCIAFVRFSVICVRFVYACL